MSVTRSEVEDFLFYEMELLDAWKMDEWVALFDEQAKYLIPSTDLDDESDPNQDLFLIMDDYERIKGRAKRLTKKTAHVEYPHAKTKHLVTNVRIKEVSQNGDKETVKVDANFLAYRSKRGADIFAGEYKYTLEKQGDQFKILEKKVILSMDSLRPHGKISILL